MHVDAFYRLYLMIPSNSDCTGPCCHVGDHSYGAQNSCVCFVNVASLREVLYIYEQFWMEIWGEMRNRQMLGRGIVAVQEEW